MNRRSFLEKLGAMGVAGAVCTTIPWFESCRRSAEEAGTDGKVRIGIIGPGSRGRFHIKNLLTIPQAEIVALCDIYGPSMEKALELVPGAKQYDDYRRMLDDKDIDAVVIATPLDRHYRMAMDAIAAGKHVFCGSYK